MPNADLSRNGTGNRQLSFSQAGTHTGYGHRVILKHQVSCFRYDGTVNTT